MKNIYKVLLVVAFVFGISSSVFAGSWATKTINDIVNFTGVTYPTDTSSWKNILNAFDAYTAQVKVEYDKSTSGATTTLPTVSQLGNPTVSQVFENGQQLVVVRQNVQIVGGNKDTSGFFNLRALSSDQPIGLPSDFGNMGSFFVKAGTSKQYPLVWKFRTLQMFPGSYTFYNDLYVVSADNSNGDRVYLSTIDLENKFSPKIVIVGEKSPYIKTVSGQTGTYSGKTAFKQSDVIRLDGTSAGPVSKVIIDGVSYAVFKTSTNSVWFELKNIKNFVAGSHIVEVESNYGKSNKVYVLFSDGVIPLPSEINLGANCKTTALDRNLTIGSKGNDVAALQNFLFDKGYLKERDTTGYFGENTKITIKAFQVAKGITPVDGYFGPLTRASVNSMCGPVDPNPNPEVTLVSASTAVNAGTAQNDDRGTFRIKFKVKAIGGEVYIPSSVANLSYVVDRAGVAVTTGIYANLVAITDTDKTSNNNYLIREGEEESFELTVLADNGIIGSSGLYSLSLRSLSWRSDDGSNNTYAVKYLSGFKTDYVSLASAKNNTQTATVLESLKAVVAELLKRK